MLSAPMPLKEGVEWAKEVSKEHCRQA